ncbi:MAG TPA: glutathione binding-like protein [Micropepsaceae bacterium]|jgi:glutathione S-transferase|nr:glutathione binding-like protein [Micropepsaceae bacterium]
MPKARLTARSARAARVKAKPAKRTTASSGAKPAAKPTASRKLRQHPIELYFWPTYNGLKISIMLEECRLPYVLKPININKGDQFDPYFLSIAPNNRMPAIVDPDGPGGKPISIFESGAILQYLGRKTGKFYPKDERRRIEVDQWLFWQVSGFGPMAGQAHHFRGYAAEKIPYAIARYTDEMNRLYGVMNRRLADRDFLAGAYSIADMACWGVVKSWDRQGQNIDDFPNVKAWWERMNARPGVERGGKVGAYLREPNYQINQDPEAVKVLFGQRARA